MLAQRIPTTPLVFDDIAQATTERNERAVREQRSGAIAWLAGLVLGIIGVIGYAAGGWIGALAFVALTVAACAVAELFDEAKRMEAKR